jgi:DNA (cytosine-5)-methyltransferase 1
LDNDPIACRTYRLNHPQVHLIEKDIRAVSPTTLIEGIAETHGLDLLVICAPCQPFSSQNRQRGNDPRAGLIIDAARFVEVLRPKCILIENVPGLTTPANSHIVAGFAKVLAAAGYMLSKPKRIDAADMGVPQRRLRCVMIASRAEPAIRAFEEADVRRRQRTVREAIGGLSALSSGECHPNDLLHRARRHRQIALDRLRAIPRDGGSRSHLPRHLKLKCHQDDHSFSDVYGRMCWDGVAPTLTTGCDDVTRGRFAHPEQDRAITLREAALLQTFPRNYTFAGNRREIARQIGNAVPVAMIEALVPLLKRVLKLSVGTPGASRP